MKKKIIAITLTALFIFMILYPKVILDGAKTGILLWFEAILPSLLPYMIISNLIILAGLSVDMAFIMKPIAKLLRITPNAAYCILAGIFFGYPSCAVAAVNMYKEKQIDRDTACFVSCAFNNISPAFIAGYVCVGIFDSPAKIAPVLALFYIILLLSTIIIRFTLFRKLGNNTMTVASNHLTKKSVFDNAIMSALTNAAKLAGYIVIFSIITTILSLIPCKYTGILCSLCEITTGINILCKEFTETGFLLLIILPMLSFGGISGIFQTFGVDTEEIIDRKKYIYSKVISMVVSLVCTYVTVYVLGILK